MHPDILYDQAKKGNRTVITFLYSDEIGLIVQPGEISHGSMLYSLKRFPDSYGVQNVEAVGKLFKVYMDDPDLYRRLIVNGRVARLDSLGEAVEDIVHMYGDEGYLISVWDRGKQLLDCVNQLYDGGYVSDPVYISTSDGLISGGEITHSKKTDPTDVDEIRRMHLMRGDEKRELMDKLGLSSGSKEHEIAAAMRKKGLLKPGQKWWTLTSEDIN